MEIKNRWMSPADIELELGIKKQTQAKMRMQGRIPYSKIGEKIVKYDRLKIDEWLENNSVIDLPNAS